MREFTPIRQTHTGLQDDWSDPATISEERPFLSLKSAFSFLNQVLAFRRHLVLGGEHVNKKASNEVVLHHCQVSVGLSWQILPNNIIVLSQWKQLTAFSDERGEKEKGEPCQGQHGDRGARGGGGKKSLLLYALYIKRKTKWMSVCNVPSRRSFKAWNSQILLKHDTTYQHFQGQMPALSCKLIRALQCNLFSKYHSTLQKNKNTIEKQGLANHSHSLWGSYVHGTNTLNRKKPNPHMCTQIDLYTHIHVNHEN